MFTQEKVKRLFCFYEEIVKNNSIRRIKITDYYSFFPLPMAL